MIVALALAVLALSVCTSPADAIIVRADGHSYGVTPIKGVNPLSLPGAYPAAGSSPTLSPAGPRKFDGLPEGGGPLTYHGGPVMHSVTTHVIYWDPNKEFTATTKGIVGKFFTDVAHDRELASNVFAVAGQYKDGSGHAAYIATVGSEGADEIAYPTSGCVPPNEADKGPYTRCITDAQLQAQLSAYVTANHLPTGPTQQYFMLLPHKVVTCLPEEAGVHPCSNNFYCAYHSSISPGSPNEIIYSDIPFSLLDTSFVKGCQDDGNKAVQHPNGDTAGTNESTRFADVALKYTSHEYTEAATDPLGTAYFDANGLENGDKCNGVTADPEKNGIGYDANSFLPTLGGSAGSGTLFDQSINTDSYYLQSEWDNAATACKMTPVPLSEAKFTASPASGVVGAPVQFTGTATDVYSALGFTWSFGDGAEGAGAAPSHTYAAPGTYEVTMTPRDELTGSTTGPVRHAFVVAGNSLPTVVTGSASALTQTSATLSATVNPNGGEVKACSFEYGTTTSYGSSAACYSLPGSGTSPVAVSASVTGLINKTTYHFRISATNAGGTSVGSDQTFAAASPHWYTNEVIQPAGIILPTIAWGTLTFTNPALGQVECRNVIAGYSENPTGGGAAVGKIQAFYPYECVSASCLSSGGTAIEVTAEKLPWSTEVAEPQEGVFRMKIGNKTKTAGAAFLSVNCAGVKNVQFFGEHAPTIINKGGTSIGSKPARVQFDQPGSGELESEAAGGLKFEGKFKVEGYSEEELISVQNP